MATSITTSLLSGCYLLAGPLASALANHFGCNVVACAGSVIAAAGFLLSVLVPALPVLYLTFGVIGGIGFGLIFLPAIVIVSQYFDEKRALATGLAVCGSGIGTTFFAWLNPLVLHLANNEWRTFLVVIALITLLCFFCGLVFKTLQPTQTQVEEVTNIATDYMEKCEHDLKGLGSHEKFAIAAETTDSPHVAGGVAIERFQPKERNGSANIQLNGRPFLSTIELNANRRNQTDLWSHRDLATIVSKESVADLNRPLSRMNIFYPGSTTHLAARTGGAPHITGEMRSRCQSMIDHKSSIYLSTQMLPPAEELGSASGITWSAGISAALRSMLDVSLLKSPSFLILAFSGFLTLSCFFVPFIFLGKQAGLKGATEEEQSYLLMTLGIINIIARVACGIISDHPNVDPLMVSNLAVIVGGVATVAVPFLSGFWMFVAYCVPFAFGVACFAALRSVICVELLGLEKLTNAYGILLLFMGVAALVGPPFAAFLSDVTGNYDLSFYVMGTMMTLSGVISLPLRYINSREVGNRNREDALSDVELEHLAA
uniref:MFS domain-containing protein n=1 Tax=Steinernema glaseri TaxID=37863 RepID=A0A1I8A2B8_9BILA